MSQNTLNGNPIFRFQDQYFRNEILATFRKIFRSVIVESRYVLFDIRLTKCGFRVKGWWEGTSSRTEFIDENTNTPDINSVIMKMVLCDHLGCQVVKSTTICLSLVFALSEVGPSKVSQFEDIVLPKKNIFRFYVSVDDLLAMNVLKYLCKLFDILRSLWLVKMLVRML